MILIRSFLMVIMLMTLFGGHALAYQYGYYSPNPYNAPRAYNPYARAQYPYPDYRGYRYPARGYTPARAPAQAQVVKTANIKAYVSSVTRDVPGIVKTSPAPAEKAIKTGSGLSDKKKVFITTLLPYIEAENRRLTVLRQNVVSMFHKLERNTALNTSEQQQIVKLAKKYRIKDSPLEDQNAREELLRKIDIIPSSLALAQAANESAWGESRFAKEANNLFGIWTYDEDKGLKPLGREDGKTHLVRIFDDLGESVRYYMYTLNSHPAYNELRKIRQQMREDDQIIDGHKLAIGLEKYSARGQAYIDLIQSLIKQNEWAQLDTNNQRA